MVEYKECPKCGGCIPKHWSYHEKCGWNVQKTKEVEGDELVREMEKAVASSFEIQKKLNEKYPAQCLRLDLTKIAITLFIQRRR